jgi:cell division inhibitor SepF
MPTMWRKAMTYLGLGPDEEYVDYDDAAPLREPAQPLREPAPERPRPVQERMSRQGPTVVRHRERDLDVDSDVAVVGTVRPVPIEPSSGIGATGPAAGQRRSGPVVRPMPVASTAKPHVLSPRSFNEAQELADKYKSNVPVIVNLQAVDRDLSRRLIDFASGLCYGLGGTMEKVAHQVYLLTPSNVEVSPEERRRLQERGFYD